MDNINIKLRRLRTSNNLTQAQLAENIGVSTATIANVEAGIRVMSTKLAIKLSDYFHTSFDYWVEKPDIEDSFHKSLTSSMNCFLTCNNFSSLDLHYTEVVVNDLLDLGYFDDMHAPLNKSINKLFNGAVNELLITALQYDILKIVISKKSKHPKKEE